jgi:predicted nicotinamide N-methyase
MLPYWAELWPSALALARHLSERNLHGERAIELGCGVGLATVAALDRGTEVLATDYYGAALDFTRHNARENVGHEPETRVLDWREPLPESLCGAFDLVFAADVLYEERNARDIARLLPALLAPGGEAVFADPGRRYEPLFRELMGGAGFGFATEERGVENDEREVTVVVHRLRRRA